jgi:hypothetical protein
MYCMALKVYTCQEAASGPKTFLSIFCKLLQQNEPSLAWQWSWFQYQLTLMYSTHSSSGSNSIPDTVSSKSKACFKKQYVLKKWWTFSGPWYFSKLYFFFFFFFLFPIIYN